MQVASMVPLVMHCVVCQETATCKVLNDRGLLAGYFCERDGLKRLAFLNSREQAERELRTNRQAAEERELRQRMRRMNGNGNSTNGHRKVTYIELSAEECAAIEACMK